MTSVEENRLLGRSDHQPTSKELNPPRLLTYFNGFALVVGIQIGSGIFSAPSVVSTRVPSASLSTFVWFLAGILVWTGAASFIELGTRMPSSGGIQDYLRECYGDVYGFLFAWIWIAVTRPCAMAMVSLVFSEYLFLVVTTDQDVSTSPLALKGTALMAIFLITCLNCLGTRVGKGAANIFLILKVLGLGSIIITGLAFAMTGLLTHGDQPKPTNDLISKSSSPASDSVTSGVWIRLGDFTDAVLAALFAYGGWESFSFVIGEIQDPQYTIPRVLHSAMAVVITLFSLTNAAYYIVLPLEILQKTNAVAMAFGTEVFGRPGALFYAIIVCTSCLGALNAIIFSTSRLTQAAGARNYLPSFLRLNTNESQRGEPGHNSREGFYNRACFFDLAKDQNTPINSMILNASLAALYVLIGNFRGLLIFKSMVEYLIYLATVFGVLVLRFRPTSAEAIPRLEFYRTHIVFPLTFCCVALLLEIRSAIKHWLQALLVFLFLGIGYFYFQSKFRPKVTDLR